MMFASNARRAIVGLSIGALTALAGCFSLLQDSDPTIACESTLNCPEGYWCDVLDGQCRPGTLDRACQSDRDCPFGAICQNSACRPGCREDGDCGLQQACFDGACADRAGTCNDERLCAFGELCGPDNACEPHPDADRLCAPCTRRLCLEDQDCPGAQRCVRGDPTLFGFCNECGTGGNCRFRGSATGCATSAECATGEFCYKRGCFDNADCQTGGIDSGVCTIDPYNPDGAFEIRSTELRSCSRGLCYAPFCTTTGCELGDCPKGYTCKQIIDVGGRGCQAQADCVAPRRCFVINETSNNGVCECLSSAECASGDCVDGFCILRTECSPAFGLVCEDIKP